MNVVRREIWGRGGGGGSQIKPITFGNELRTYNMIPFDCRFGNIIRRKYITVRFQQSFCLSLFSLQIINSNSPVLIRLTFSPAFLNFSSAPPPPPPPLSLSLSLNFLLAAISSLSPSCSFFLDCVPICSQESIS